MAHRDLKQQLSNYVVIKKLFADEEEGHAFWTAVRPVARRIITPDVCRCPSPGFV